MSEISEKSHGVEENKEGNEENTRTDQADDNLENVLEESTKRKRDEEETENVPPEKRSKSLTEEVTEADLKQNLQSESPDAESEENLEIRKDALVEQMATQETKEADDFQNVELMRKDKGHGNGIKGEDSIQDDSKQTLKSLVTDGEKKETSVNYSEENRLEEKKNLELNGDDENSQSLSNNGEEVVNDANGQDDDEKDSGRNDEDGLSNSSAKSEDSEKENRQTVSEMPMDLSTKSSNDNSQDIIMLSDSEEEPVLNGYMNGFSENGFTRDEICSRRKFLKQLQAELRNEEAKLVLLKKLRQSQISSSQQLQEINRQTKNSQPPPLVRPGQQSGQSQARPAHSQPPQLLRGNQNMSNRAHQQGPPPLVNMRGQNMDSRNSMSQQMRYPGMTGSTPSNSYRQGSNTQSPQVPVVQQPADTQTPAQRQAAAKMALRKQLEKTLLQIPPPKPPPPEMNFVPSLSSPDFIYLLGLEEAVNYIIDANLISKGQKNPDEKMVCNPFTCVQCNTDFTPVWKREKVGSKNVICEHCVTTNQKKALKQEHTNRLKSAFVKALQQEQEIERMQAQEKSSGNPPQTSGSSSPALNGSPSPMNMVSSQSYKSTADTLRQHQNFLQAHQAAAAHQTALRMGQPLGLAPFAAAARGAFSYQMPFGSPKELNQLQRQYLLDMIPNRGTMPWKP